MDTTLTKVVKSFADRPKAGVLRHTNLGWAPASAAIRQAALKADARTQGARNPASAGFAPDDGMAAFCKIFTSTF